MIIVKTQGGAIVPVRSPFLIDSHYNTVNVYDTNFKDVLELGTYDSEIRARAVVDMIEKHICKERIVKVGDITLENNTIFTMPKE